MEARPASRCETGPGRLGETGAARSSRTAARRQIETPYLQLVMTRLWDEERRRGFAPPARGRRSTRLGGAERSCARISTRSMGALPPTEQDARGRGLPLPRHAVRGPKIAHTAADLADYAGRPAERAGALLEKLSAGRLASCGRCPAAGPAGEPRYEIFHDVLAPAILDWRARFVQGQQRSEAEHRAEDARHRAEGQTPLRGAFPGWSEPSRLRPCWRWEPPSSAGCRPGSPPNKQSSRIARGPRLRRNAIAPRQRSTLVTLRHLRREPTRAHAEEARERAEAERQRAEQQARLATSRELAAAAIGKVDTDKELSLLLAVHAVSVTYSVDKTITNQAEAALHQAIQAPRAKQTLSGHAAAVLSVTFSPDGRRLATASGDRTAKPLGRGHRPGLLTLERPHRPGRRAWPSARTGRRLATASEDRTVRLWDAGLPGRPLLTLEGHAARSGAWRSARTATRLATGGRTGRSSVWDAATGQAAAHLSGHTGRGRERGVQPGRPARWPRPAGRDRAGLGRGHGQELAHPQGPHRRGR